MNEKVSDRKKPNEATSRQKRKHSSKRYPLVKRIGENSQLGSGLCNFHSGNNWPNEVQSSNSGGKKHLVPKHDLIKYHEDPNPKHSKLDADPVIDKPIVAHPKNNCFPDCNGPISIQCFPGKLNDTSPTPQTTMKVHEKNYYERDFHNNLDWDVGLDDGNVQDSEVINLNDSFASSLNLNGIFHSENLDVHDEHESGYSSSDSRISGAFLCSEQKMGSEVPKFSDWFDCSLLSFGNISYLEFPLGQNS